MTRSDCLSTAAVAVASCAVTLALLWPTDVNAGKDGLTPQIEKPALTVNGAIISIEPAAATYQPGEKPVVTLTVHNPTDKPVDVKSVVAFFDQPPTPPESRMVSMPVPTHHREQESMVQAGQTRTITIASDKPVEAGHRVSYQLSADGKTVRLPAFTVPGELKVAGPRRVPATANLPAAQAAAQAK